MAALFFCHKDTSFVEVTIALKLLHSSAYGRIPGKWLRKFLLFWLRSYSWEGMMGVRLQVCNMLMPICWKYIGIEVYVEQSRMMFAIVSLPPKC